MVITEITKIGKMNNCIIIPKYDYRQLGWAEKQKITIKENEDRTGLIIEPA